MLNIEDLLKEVTFNFSRSGGKGGQNVNKVETKVELVFNVKNSNVFNVEQKELLLLKLKNRIDGEGNLRIISQSERTQLGNRKKAVEKFKKLIEKSLLKRKKRVRTRIPKAVKEKILESKKKQSEKKQQRRKIEF